MGRSFAFQFVRFNLIKHFGQHKTILHCSQKVSFKVLKFADIVVFASESSYVKIMFYPTVTAISFVPNRLDFVAKIVEIPLFALVLLGKWGTSESRDLTTFSLSRQNPPKHNQESMNFLEDSLDQIAIENFFNYSTKG